MEHKKTYFITGIDTDAGKTWVTGAFARYLVDRGQSVVTQKIAQTGCVGTSEDIERHRLMMGTGTLPGGCAGAYLSVYLYRTLFAAPGGRDRRRADRPGKDHCCAQGTGKTL